jgi:SPOR domain
MSQGGRSLAIAAFLTAILSAHVGPSLQAQTPAKVPATPAQSDATASEPSNKAAGKSARKKKDATEGQAAVQAAIETAIKLVESGKADQAVQSLSTVLSAGSLPPTIMAKALYWRGVAYRKLNKPAQAISDLTSALWLKGGLSESERAEAQENRAAAYREAGLPDQVDAETKAKPKPSVKAAAASGSTQKDETTTTQTSSFASSSQTPPPAETTTSGGFDLSNLFGSIFGGAAPATNTPPPTASLGEGATSPASEQVSPAVPRSKRNKVVSSATPPSADANAASTAQVKPPGKLPPAASAGGRFRVQVAAVRTEKEAQSAAQKLKQQLGAAVEGREPEIDQAVYGSMGAFYRVRIGPYASAQESQSLCTKLKGSGLDCFVVTP